MSETAPSTAFARRSDEARFVADLIRSDILDGYLRGTLPLEFELVRRYTGSRNSVREALAQLRDQGLLSRSPRTGTMVVADDVVFSFDRPGEPILIREPGVSTNSDVEDSTIINYQWRPAPESVARRLEIAPGDQVAYVETAVSVRGLPLRIRQSWIPLERSGAAFRASLRHASVTDLLERELGVTVITKRLVMAALNADDRTAGLLGLQTGAALFMTERLAVLPNGDPIEYGFARYRGDRVVWETRTSSVGA